MSDLRSFKLWHSGLLFVEAFKFVLYCAVRKLPSFAHCRSLTTLVVTYSVAIQRVSHKSLIFLSRYALVALAPAPLSIIQVSYIESIVRSLVVFVPAVLVSGSCTALSDMQRSVFVR